MKNRLSAVKSFFTAGVMVMFLFAVICAVPNSGFSQTTTESKTVKAVQKKASPTKKKSVPKSATKKKVQETSETLCVVRLNVIEGCEVCDTMMDWLKKGGVKLEIKNAEVGKYSMYPTVEYSDKATDNGERIYEHIAKIPPVLPVVKCKSVSQ